MSSVGNAAEGDCFFESQCMYVRDYGSFYIVELQEVKVKCMISQNCAMNVCRELRPKTILSSTHKTTRRW